VRSHDQKIKDMSRSVLPSTGRASARKDRRIIHKRRRARELAAVAAWRRDAGPESVTPGIRGMDARDITWMVWRRRGRDKAGRLSGGPRRQPPPTRPCGRRPAPGKLATSPG
jgi:hypothetical protein